MRCCSALTMSWKSERNLPFLIILILLLTILFFLDLNCETITKDGSSTFSLTLSSSRSPSSSSSSASSSWSSFWSPPDHLWCICVSEGGCLMGVQCGTLRGGGSLAYRTLEGGGGAEPNTLLDVESITQCTTLVSPTTHWRKGGTVPNSLLTVESTALHLTEKAPMLQCCSHITMHCNKQGESSML